MKDTETRDAETKGAGNTGAGAAAPAGYMEDGMGRLWPADRVPEVCRLRDRLVRELCAEAERLEREMNEFQARALSDMAAFAQLAAEAHGAAVGGEKGNMTLSSFDGRL